MRKMILFLAIAFLFFALPADAASADGSAVLAADGTIYQISAGERRGFPSAEVFYSHGFEFKDALPASADDLALPTGAPLTYAEGALVKPAAEAVVYFVSDGKKLPFQSGSVFLGLGFSFGNIYLDRGNLLPSFAVGEPVSSALASHPAGALVNDSGTVYLVTSSGKKGIPSVEVFNSHRFRFTNVVPANTADRDLPVEGLLLLKGSSPAAPSPESPASSPPPAGEDPNKNKAPETPVISGVIASFPQTTENFSFSSRDPEGKNLVLTIDWGDGSAKLTQSAASGVKLNFSHAWAFIGDYNLTVSADDGQGGITATTQKIIVDNDTSRFGPAVIVLTPNGGEKFIMGRPVNVTWKRNWMPKTAYGKSDVYYRRAGLNTLIKSGAEGQSMDWIPLGIPSSDDYKIVVISQGTGGSSASITSDESDANFSVTAVQGAVKRGY